MDAKRAENIAKHDVAIDERSFRQRQRGQLSERVEAGRKPLEFLAQAEIKAGNLTGHRDWDFYLSLLQAEVDQLEAVAAQLRAKLEDPKLVSAEALMLAKISLVDVSAHIAAREHAMQLPAVIMKQGRQAAELLAKIDGG